MRRFDKWVSLKFKRKQRKIYSLFSFFRIKTEAYRSVPQSSALDVKAKIQYMQFTGAADFRQLDLVGAGLQKRYTLINYKF